MSTPDSVDDSVRPQASQESSGVLNFILSKLGRPSRSISKLSGSMVSEGHSAGAAAVEDGKGAVSLPKDEEEIQSRLAEDGDTQEKGKAIETGQANTAEKETSIRESRRGDIIDRRGDSLPAPSLASNAHTADPNQWNFARRFSRKQNRLAQEYVRESTVERHSEWSKSLAEYNPEASGMTRLHEEEAVPEERRFKEDGVYFRRRSKSDHGLLAAAGLRDFHRSMKSGKEEESNQKEMHQAQPRGRQPVNRRPQGHHGSKRSSFEAGLEQDPETDGSSRKSAEKVQRQARNDFLPDELVQRSQLFNGYSK